MNKSELVRLAKEARLKAHSPYSGFKVGASLLTDTGHVFTGSNVENSSYGLTVCAERVAAFKAVSEGETGFKQLVIVTDTEEITPPCGACLQVLVEFCEHLPILMINLEGKELEKDLYELLPLPFKSFGGPSGP